MYRKALRVLYGLQAKGVARGDELILQIDHVESFVVLFWACILGGIIPVPITVGKNNEHKLKLYKVWDKLNNPHMVTTPDVLDALESFDVICDINCSFQQIKAGVIMLSELEASESKGQIAKISTDDIAFIQFSSGSTGSPKGVVLTHSNLTTNIFSIMKNIELKHEDVALSWMPLTHDMGLIGCHLVPLSFAINHYIMPTSLFVRRPWLWMEKASEHKITITVSPNFGYQYLIKMIENKDEYTWDLSNLRLILNGAEPISTDVCEKFLNYMDRYGLRGNVIFPVYGLAEASLAVTFPPVNEKFVSVNIDRKSLSVGDRARVSDTKNDQSVAFVDLGFPIDFCDIRICDEYNNVLGEYMVGYVQIKGTNVTKGYYNDTDTTAGTISSEGWLNTGDLGFVRDGRLIITGRAKDVIFVHGQNYYAHDIERVAEAVEGTKPGETAACSCYSTEKARDIVILFVYFKKSLDAFVPLAIQLKRHIRLIMGLEIDSIIPLKKIPKTTSGKIERYKLADNYGNNEFEKVLNDIAVLEKDIAKSAGHQDIPKDRIEETLIHIVRNVIGTDSIGLDDNLIEFGGNSILLTNVHSRLDDIYPGIIKISDLFTYPTVRKLAEYIRGVSNNTESIDVTQEVAACGYTSELSHEDIAIIGINAALPIVDELDEFWEGIRNGICFATEFPMSRKADIERYLEFKDEKNTNLKFYEGAYLKNIDEFDYSFFRISPREAGLMNPAQRMFLETVIHAVEDSGYGGDKLKGENIGVFVGQISDSEFYKYKEMIHDTDPESLPICAIGNISALIPNRVSYTLDVKGPSMVIDTACSSSLVALHMACQAIKNGDCDAAVVGSSRINYIPCDKDYYKIGIESSDNMTRTFDKYADGSGTGEGVIAVMIKPLNRALVDRDNIYAVIKGSAVNQDGASVGITVPSARYQSEVILKAWRNAGINPETLSWIEAHGTGTKIGDVIEVEGLQEAMSKFTSKKQFCAIGSVKSNFGHLYESAGLIGLIKAVLSLKNKEIPPSIEFNEPNDKIDFTQTAFYVNTKSKCIKGSNTPIRCGVSSFGIGGTNCHFVLEDAPDSYSSEIKTDMPYILTLSAGKLESLEKLVSEYDEFFNSKVMDSNMLGNICFTANTGRGHHVKRLAILFDGYKDICKKISALNMANLNKVNMEDVFFGETDMQSRVQDIGQVMELEERRAEINRQTADITERFIASNCANSRLGKELCSLYVQGGAVDWERIYGNRKYARISLPVYPFDRKRCWLNIPQRTAQDNVFYSVNWRSSPLPAEQPSIMENIGPILIMKDEADYGEKLAERFLELNTDIIKVCRGEASGDELAQMIENKGIMTVVYLFSHGQPQPEDEKGICESQDRGVFFLFELIQALLRIKLSNTVNVVLISDPVYQVTGKETELKPENAPMFGFSKVTGIESSRIKCKCLDIDNETRIEEIAKEIFISNKDLMVAYRNGIRYVEVLGEMEAKPPRGNNMVLRSDGVYVITGGLGGIGIEIAKRMASREKVNIALINRSSFPEKADWERILQDGSDISLCSKISSLKEIESSGSTVVLVALDISRVSEVALAIDDLGERFGRINGVIHAAGVAGSGLIMNKDIDTLKQVILPKVWGTWALDKATEKYDMDFFALFSSALTLSGDIGQSDYAAANAYLDAFVASRGMKKSGTITFNWVEWSETGMAYRHGFNSGGFFKPLSTQTGLDAFERLIGSGIQRAVIGEINMESCYLREMAEKSSLLLSDKIQSRLATVKTGKRPDVNTGSMAEVRLAGRKEGDYTETERNIAGMCKRVLGFDEVHIHDSFFELGADSILIKRIYLLLDEKYPGRLAITDLFAYSSVYKLASFLDGTDKGSSIIIEKSLAADETLVSKECQESYSVNDALEYIRKL